MRLRVTQRERQTHRGREREQTPSVGVGVTPPPPTPTHHPKKHSTRSSFVLNTPNLTPPQLSAADNYYITQHSPHATGKGRRGRGWGRRGKGCLGRRGVGVTRTDNEESVTILNIRLLVTTAYKLSQRVSSRKKPR